MTTQTARFLFASLVATFSGLASARADVDAVIAKARAYLGPEAALNAVQSVHFTGTLVTSEATAAGPKPIEAVVDIIFQRPYRQRIMATSEKGIETTALDSYDGWHRVQDPKDPSRWRMDLLSKDQIKRLRANTWENLSFYRGLELKGGTVEDLGPATVDGVACQKLAFRHEAGIVFFRYFDQATGRLVLTETEQGGTIREQGEIMAGGLRFPKTVVTTTKQADGKERSVTVNFDKVGVNEAFDGSIFSVPAFTPSTSPPPAAAPAVFAPAPAPAASDPVTK
jgi:hypothetical protein